MKALGYYLTYPVLWLVSLLPFAVLHRIADGLAWLNWHVIKYRKNVVLDNLRRAFPHWPEEKVEKTARAFFVHLFDVFLETVKVISISREEIDRRFVLDENSRNVLRKYKSEGKAVIMALGHYGNWEWGPVNFGGVEGFQLLCIYRKLSNPYFGKLMNRIRGKFGSVPVEANETYRAVLKRKGECTLTALISDQTPPPEGGLWINFLGRKTPVYRGAEVLGKRTGYPVLFAHIDRTARGQYHAWFEVVSENPSELPENDLTLKISKILEADIVKKPELWLWSHKRWKHTWKEEYGFYNPD
jgi:Kdo2-lipid IVA lauroyltransferase/acyltransferase